MANPQSFNPYGQNKGTLTPGQTIAVNKYTVTVERYLSQGGFAHVYLVTTPAPVYNTTHHVLKRIAVQNEAMLTDVKKEVDIMRLLKGHPNIVHLIDAAWHRMADGTFEVFILMEFCPGGGIIDMMNRRLRERLTEAEILTIFADVCEGVACMHNLRPPLLHRDLKVENILQASATSYKLCDFGSAATVAPRPPATTQEIRALEADLNRHTTLQYRAPEMVDPFLRRPVDEKSDVWALGVLLYKLCYYTTPFEEHGPLAILNVQYRIPPYPVYSQQMNALIASMLREHGTHRPSVFELLNIVHRLRGTKPLFQYNIPAPQLPLGTPIQSQSQAQPSKSLQPANPAETTISFRAAPQVAAQAKATVSTSPAKNNGIQAREKVLEALAPMRRGRPTQPSPSNLPKDLPPPSFTPSFDKTKEMTLVSPNFDAEEDKAWKKVSNQGDKENKVSGKDNAWALSNSSPATQKNDNTPGFGDDFAEKLWGSYGNSKPADSQPLPAPTRPPPLPNRPSQGADTPRIKPATPGRSKDAFEGLGLDPSSVKPAPTLGEARKLRTGLATLGSSSFLNSMDASSSSQGTSIRPSPSPRPSYLQPKQTSQASISPAPSPASSWRSHSPRPGSSTMDNAEMRFPSLEELDANFSTESRKLGSHASSQPQLGQSPSGHVSDVKVPRETTSQFVSHSARSHQVTGTAMREAASRRQETLKDGPATHNRLDNSTHASRPTLQRKHRSSVTIKSTPPTQPKTQAPPSSNATDTPDIHPKPPPKQTTTTNDWLTGDDDSIGFTSTITSPPIVRDSPSKRASFIEGTSLSLPQPIAAQHEQAPSPIQPVSPLPTSNIKRKPVPSLVDTSLAASSAPNSTTAPSNTTPSASLTENWSPVTPKGKEIESSSSADEGPEEATSSLRRSQHGYKPKSERQSKRKSRQSSVHDLVDLWGGGVTTPTKDRVESTNRSLSIQETTPKPTGNKTIRLPPSKPISPQPTLSQPTTPEPSTLRPKVDVSHLRQQTLHSPSSSPMSSKFRPQSMFLFPSRPGPSDGLDNPQSPDGNSKGLAPPDTPRTQSNIRRTSISDMVNLYESIGGKNQTTNTASPKSWSQANMDVTRDNPSPKRESLLNPTTVAKALLSSGAPLPDIPRDNSSPLKREILTSSVGVTKAATASNPDNNIHDTRRDTGASGKESPSEPRQRKFSRAASPLKETFFGKEMPSHVAKPLPIKPSTSEGTGVHAPRPTFPLRKMTLPPEDKSSTPASEPRSPSPERPYQGVGKLIDQWQRKAVSISNENAAAIPPRRGATGQKWVVNRGS